MGEWPWQAILAVLGLVLTNLATLGRGAFKIFTQADDSSFRIHERGWTRVSELETEIRLLRIALSRAQLRGSDYSIALEIFVLAYSLPLEDRIRAARQARRILERSLTGSKAGSGE